MKIDKDNGESAVTLLLRLQKWLLVQGPVALAVSGGVDSMTLAVVACRINSASAVFHAVSPAVPAAATARVRQYASEHNWQLHCIDAGEMHDVQYRANPQNRCYFCKDNLYRSVRRVTHLPIAAGTNLDDLQDYRPGLLAAREQEVVHPLVQANIDKRGLRAIAAVLGLHELEELPASPCLSSRVTTGIAIDPDLLPLIDSTEEALRKLLHLYGANADLRCRIRNNSIDIELPLQLSDPQAEVVRQTVTAKFRNSRFSHYSNNVLIMPYRKGSAFVRATSA